MQTSKVTARNQLPSHFIQEASPRLYSGAGSVSALPEMLKSLDASKSVLLLTGNSAFAPHGFGPHLLSLLEEHGYRPISRRVHGEPSPGGVDDVVSSTRKELGGNPDAVVGVGGGSVMDAAKAASAAFLEEGSIKEYLEGVGSRAPSGRRLPLILASTTAGTGSEGTKNAVLSKVGEGGFKKSLRHDRFVPDIAVLDPELHRTTPREVTAASGLDAVTQLLEAYVSTKATPLTDVYCEVGLTQAAWALPMVLTNPKDLEARSSMALAAYLSGLSLATAGLGLVHGAASPLGAARDIPHGVVCGTLIGEVSRRSVAHLFQEKAGSRGGAPFDAELRAGLSFAEGADPDRSRAKYANAGRILTGERGTDFEMATALLAWLDEIAASIPRLGAYGFTREELSALAGKCGDKNQPVAFNDDATARLFEARL